METAVDLRLFGVMACLAYVAYTFVGDAYNPLATSRRPARNLRLSYARSVAAVLLASPLVSLWVPVQGLKDGVLLSLTAAIGPLSLISLGFGFVAFRHWQVRRRERLDPDFRDRDQAPSLTLDQLRDLQAEATMYASGEESPSEGQEAIEAVEPAPVPAASAAEQPIKNTEAPARDKAPTP